MARNSTQTAKADFLEARVFAIDDVEGGTASLQDRLHISYPVAYNDSASGGEERQTVTLKVTDAGPRFPGAESLGDATVPGGGSANNRFTQGEITQLINVLTKGLALAQEKLEL
jgi:hypothetical protein